MTTERQRAEGAALYARWAEMWNGELEISDEIIAQSFVAHSTADAMTPPEDICDARTVRGWIQAIRSRLSGMTYRVEVGPLVDGNIVAAYWRVAGTLAAPDGTKNRVIKVGTDILRIEGKRFVECWTMNNNAKAD
jgi:hypothetical protein